MTNRKEYFKEYRRKNREKLIEYSRMKNKEYKERQAKESMQDDVLIWLAYVKQEKINNMDAKRLQRRYRNQKGIEA